MFMMDSSVWNIFAKIRRENDSFNSEDVLNSYIICALVLKAKQKNISLDKSSRSLVNELYGDNFPHIFNDIDIKNLSFFYDVSIEELKSFILDYQYALYVVGKKGFVSFIPEKIISLICKLIELGDADTIGIMGESSSVSVFQIAENYSLSNINSYSLRCENKEILELLSESLGYNIHFVVGEYYSFNNIKLTNKVISFPMWGCDTEHNVMESYLEKKGYKNARNNSAEAGILFALDALSEDGLAAVYVPLNLIQKNDNLILKDIVDKKQLKAIVSLPSGISPVTNIKTAVLILSKKQNDTVRFVIGSEFFTKNRKLCNELSDANIMEISNAYYNSSEYAKNVAAEEIKAKNYSLNYINYFVEPKIVIVGMGKKNFPYVKISELLITKPIRGTLIKSEVLDSETGNTNYRYLTSKNIVDNEIDSYLPEIPEQNKKVDKYCLKKNDIVLSVVTTDTIKVAIAQDIGNLNIVVSNMLYKLTPNSDKVRPLYLKAVLSHPDAARIFKAYSSGAGSISTLPIDVLCNTEIALPPLDKQDIFVKNYEKLVNTRCMLIEQINEIDKSKKLLFEIIFGEK